jgi:hypothetical protein
MGYDARSAPRLIDEDVLADLRELDMDEPGVLQSLINGFRNTGRRSWPPANVTAEDARGRDLREPPPQPFELAPAHRALLADAIAALREDRLLGTQVIPLEKTDRDRTSLD